MMKKATTRATQLTRKSPQQSSDEDNEGAQEQAIRFSRRCVLENAASAVFLPLAVAPATRPAWAMSTALSTPTAARLGVSDDSSS